MDRRFDSAALKSAWRALAGGTGEGWRTILVANLGRVRIHAGRHLPSDRQSVEFHLPDHDGMPDTLPEGRGFSMVRIREPADLLAVTREPDASESLFELMASDLIEDIATREARGDTRLAATLVARVRAWQDFMERGHDGILRRDAEIGLFGELTVLVRLIHAGFGPRAAVDTWSGPSHGLHDFEFGGPAMEVKSSTASKGFVARIDSLEQLDNANAAPLLLAAVALEAGKGRTLPDLIADVDGLLESDDVASQSFDQRLIRAGFIRNTASRYSNRYELRSVVAYTVDGQFPRLIHGNVPPGVSRARYDIDLGSVAQVPMTEEDMIRTLQGN